MSRLTASLGADPATWLVAALQTFGESVTSLVPGGFAAYVRVFHPAYRRTEEGTLVPVRWAAIAAANGTEAHPIMQLIPLVRSEKFIHEGEPGVYDHPPHEGSLPAELIAPLLGVLSRHTTTPDRCWFAVWMGFGATGASLRAAARFHLPARDYYLLEGPIGAASETVLDPPSRQSPNLWWPDDHAWCVATEIDLNTTYIGCSELCRDALLALPELETAAVTSDDAINWKSDTINPWPDSQGRATQG